MMDSKNVLQKSDFSFHQYFYKHLSVVQQYFYLYPKDAQVRVIDIDGKVNNFILFSNASWGHLIAYVLIHCYLGLSFLCAKQAK
jgi:hypothetical protein